MSQYFPKPYEPFGKEINVNVDLADYATKTDLKNISHVDVSSFALQLNLANLKTEVDKLDTDKLTPVPNDLAKLSNAVKNDVVKNTEYNKLVAKANNIDTAGFVLKTTFVLKTAKITEIENKIPSITGLATNSALTAVENKIPNVSSLVEKTDYDTKISEIEKKVSDHNQDKYITTPEFNNLAAGVFDARLAQVDLVAKADFDIKLQDISKRFSSKKTKHLLVENELRKLKTLSYFKGKDHFGEDGTNCLVFQTINKYFKRIIGVANGEYIYFSKSKDLSHEKINSITASNYSITPSLDYLGAKIRVKFNGSCLKQDKVTYTQAKIVNIYIVYKISKNCNISSNPTLKNYLLGAVSLTKNNDIDQYKYSGLDLIEKDRFSLVVMDLIEMYKFFG